MLMFYFIFTFLFKRDIIDNISWYSIVNSYYGKKNLIKLFNLFLKSDEQKYHLKTLWQELLVSLITFLSGFLENFLCQTDGIWKTNAWNLDMFTGGSRRNVSVSVEGKLLVCDGSSRARSWQSANRTWNGTNGFNEKNVYRFPAEDSLWE